jgi:glutamate/tyrosine decarboxylase-like PLP-dependent enzyme
LPIAEPAKLKDRNFFGFFCFSADRAEAMFEQLDELAQQARQLDPSSDVINAWMAELGEFTHRYLAELDRQPASAEQDVGQVRPGFKEQGETFSKALALLKEHVLSSGFNASSGRFMGYVPGGGIPTAAIGDFLAALTNRYAGVYAASPGAGEIENECLRWMRNLVGYPASGWGTLQSGGTLATLTALVAARDTRPADEWRRGVAYATSETHHAFQKCLKIIGLGSMKVTLVATDEAHRMSVAALKGQIAADRAAGLDPWIVCISAGTTNTGAVDPIEELLAVAREEGLWGHVDAAYGGFFLLTERGKELMRGISEADSIVLDPHKGLFLPYGCGAVLVKDAAKLRNAFASSADYLADVEGQGGLSASDYSPEGTRHFRGLRLWLSLTVSGLENYRAALEEKMLLAEYAFERLQTIEGIEVAPRPELSCVAFRAAAGDAATKDLLERIVKTRKAYASSTRIDERLYIRFCILNFRTHREHVDQALAEVAV